MLEGNACGQESVSRDQHGARRFVEQPRPDRAKHDPHRAAVPARADRHECGVALLDLVKERSDRLAGDEDRARGMDGVDRSLEREPRRTVELDQDVAHRPPRVCRRGGFDDRR
jgi:hypothetical protein